MKFLFITFLVVPLQHVLADRIVTFFFNNGQPITESMNCTDADNALINPIFNTSLYARRNLRIASDSTGYNNNISVTNNDRDLGVTRCKDDCLGQVGSMCRSLTGCSGKGRMLQENLPLPSMTCSEQLETMHSKLDNLIATNAVSPSCQLLLESSKRNATCTDGILSGEIESFKIARTWNDPRRCVGFIPGRCPFMTTVYTNVQNGFSFCTSNDVTIETVIIPCLSKVTTTLTGPNGYTSSKVYTVIPMKSIHAKNSLPAGNYTLTAVPDDKQYKKREFLFTVKAGC